MIKYLRHPLSYWVYVRVKLISLFKTERKCEDWFRQFNSYFLNKHGIEIGGPSNLFRTAFMPVYELSASIDGCNFSNQTVWEGDIVSDQYNYFEGKSGKQYICEGSDLSLIENEQYDFLLSCHNLEHIANPLKALIEWSRIVKKGGIIVVVLPDKRFTFDRKRPYTQFGHLKEDFDRQTSEEDLTHLDEILELHDLQLDRGAGEDFEKFKKRGKANFENRCLHHHVFSDKLLKEASDYLNLETLSQYFMPPLHKIIIAKKK